MGKKLKAKKHKHKNDQARSCLATAASALAEPAGATKPPPTRPTRQVATDSRPLPWPCRPLDSCLKGPFCACRGSTRTESPQPSTRLLPQGAFLRLSISLHKVHCNDGRNYRESIGKTYTIGNFPGAGTCNAHFPTYSVSRVALPVGQTSPKLVKIGRNL